MEVTQSWPSLCDTMGCIVHGVLQARILEWAAFSFSRASSQPRDWTQVQHCRCILYQLSHKGGTRILEWVAYPFSSGSSQPRNWTGSPASQADSLPTELSGKPPKYRLPLKKINKQWNVMYNMMTNDALLYIWKLLNYIWNILITKINFLIICVDVFQLNLMGW